jgi:hypothetical protein
LPVALPGGDSTQFKGKKMKKKKMRSKRNRHTERINAFKNLILKKNGVIRRASDNTRYKVCFDIDTFVRID